MSGETSRNIEGPDVGRVIADYIAASRVDDLPREVVQIAKSNILDTIGVILAASTLAHGIDAFHEVSCEMGGTPESTILGFGSKAPAALAAFVNGAMAHSLDYDDLLVDLSLHPSSSTVPPALAIAQRQGASGADLLTAVAVANEFCVRLGHCVDWSYGWFTTPLFGHFTAAAAASKLLGLDADGIFRSFGLAFCQASGSRQMRISTGSNIASFYAAWPCKSGVMSGLMSAKGIGGIENVFEGKAGFFALCYDGKYDRSALTSGLGVQYHANEVSFKPWGACGGTHPSIDGALQLAVKHDIDPKDVESVVVHYGDPVLTDLCTPRDKRRHPSTSMDAKWSIPFTVAVALVRRNVTLASLSLDALTQPDVLALADRVVTEFDPALSSDSKASHAQVTVHFKDGGSATCRVEDPYGRVPNYPMKSEDIIDKFRECASYSRQPIKPDAVERAIELVMDLENLESVQQLCDCLTGTY